MAVPTIIFLIKFASNLASHADVLRGPSRVPAPRTVRGVGTRDEPLRTSEWEAKNYPSKNFAGSNWTYQMNVKHSRDVTEENMQVISYMYFSLQKMNLTN